jgi:hypothetical protein
MLTDTQIREAFHFCFLERLLKLSDPDIYILKGGVNLRFYFNSPRYSEDMDIDVLHGSVATLKKNGYKILEDAAFERSLRVFDIVNIEINDPNKAKQTATTQRFRCSLITPAGHRLPTKVEFSRRKPGVVEDAPMEFIDVAIARQYRKLAYRCRHYSGEAAVLQKIKALSGRPVTQARDVFDLGILFAGGHFPSTPLNQLLPPSLVAKSLDCLMSLTWDDFKGQVVEFLDDEHRSEYGTPAAWSAMQELVLERLTPYA